MSGAAADESSPLSLVPQGSPVSLSMSWDDPSVTEGLLAEMEEKEEQLLHAAEFGQAAFRQAFPLHVTLYVVLIGISVQCVSISGSQEMRSAYAALALVGTVALGARVAVRRMHDRAEAHRYGAIS